MKYEKIALFTLLVVSGTFTLAQAQINESNSQLFTYGKFGTQGATIGAGYTVNDRFAFRAGFNTGATYSSKRRIDDIRYDASRKTDQSIEALADWYPFANHGVRLTGGVLLTDTATRLTSRPSNDYIINGNTYSSEEVGDLAARVKTDSLAPYLGLGWESSKPGQRGLRFTGDVGIIHHASRRVSLTASGSTSNDQLSRDLSAEQSRIKAVNDLALVVSVGISYSF